MKKKYLVWEDNIGNAVAIENDFFFRKIYLKFYSKIYNRGQIEKFFEVKTLGGSFCGEKAKCGFDNPHNPMKTPDGVHHQHNGKVFRDGDFLCLDLGTSPIIFSKKRETDEIDIVPLPEVRVREYLLHNDQQNIYLSYNKYMASYDDYKMFIGPVGSVMKEIQIDDMTRYRDGGTTIIKTKAGELYIPTPFKKKDHDYKITFNGEQFFEYSDTTLVEEKGSVARVIG